MAEAAIKRALDRVDGQVKSLHDAIMTATRAQRRQPAVPLLSQGVHVGIAYGPPGMPANVARAWVALAVRQAPARDDAALDWQTILKALPVPGFCIAPEWGFDVLHLEDADTVLPPDVVGAAGRKEMPERKGGVA